MNDGVSRGEMMKMDAQYGWLNDDVKSTDTLVETLHAFNMVETLKPVAKRASMLRGCGIRMVADHETMAAFQKMAEEGNPDAALIVANMFPKGHPETMKKNEERLPPKSIWRHLKSSIFG